MKAKLTKDYVEKVRPGEAPFEIHDTHLRGLLLRVQPSGVMSYIVTWGRAKRRTLGRHPVMTLAMARAAAMSALSEALTHGAPLAVIEETRQSTKTIETFGDFITERYAPHTLATAKAGKATIHCITTQFGYLFERQLASISRADFDDFKAKRLNAGTHPSTVNRDLDRIKAALTAAVEWNLLETNPLRGVKRIKRGIEDRVRYLSKAEEKALRKALEARDAKFQTRRASANAWRSKRGKDTLPAIQGYADHLTPMTLIALNTGLRRGELTQLRWSDINLAGKMLTVRAGYAKSGKARHVPLNSEAVAVLKALQKTSKTSEPLFDLTCVAKSWGRLMTAAKLEDFRFHDLRHTFASKLVMAGVDLNTVRELLGHGDIAMSLRYAHLAPEHKAAAVEMLVK